MNNKLFASLLLTSALLTTMNACVAMDRLPENKKSIPSRPKATSSITDEDFMRTFQQAIDGDERHLLPLVKMIHGKRKLYLQSIIPGLVAQDKKTLTLFNSMCIASPETYLGILEYRRKNLIDNPNPLAQKQLPGINKAIDGFESFIEIAFRARLETDRLSAISLLSNIVDGGSTFAKKKLEEIKESEAYKYPCDAEENTLGLILRQEESRKWFEGVYTPQFLNRSNNTQFSLETAQNFAARLFLSSITQINFKPGQDEANRMRLSQGYRDAAKGKLDRKKTRDPVYCLGQEFCKLDRSNYYQNEAKNSVNKVNETTSSLPGKKASVGIANSWTGETIDTARIETGKTGTQKNLSAHYLEMPSIVEGAKRGDAHAYARFLALVKQGETSFYSFFFSYLEAGDPEAYDLFARLFNDSTAFPQSILDYTEKLKQNIINPTLLATIERALAQAEILKKKAAIDLSRKADETACLRLAKESWGKNNNESIAHYIMAEHYGIPEGIELLTSLRQSESYQNPKNASPNDPGAILRDQDDTKKARSSYNSFTNSSLLLPSERAALLYEAVQLGHEEAIQMSKAFRELLDYPEGITDFEHLQQIIERGNNFLSYRAGKKNLTDDEKRQMGIYVIGQEYLLLEYNSLLKTSPSQNLGATISKDQKPALSDEKEAKPTPKTPSVSLSPESSKSTSSSREDSSKSTQCSASRETKVDAPSEIGDQGSSNGTPAPKAKGEGAKSDKSKANKTLKPSKNDSKGGKILQRTRSLTNVSRPSENTSSTPTEKPRRELTRTQSLMNLRKVTEDAEQPSLDKSEKKLTRRNSVSKEEPKDVKKFLKRRDSEKKLKRRESESKLEVAKPWVIPSIKFKYKDILVRVARRDNVGAITIKAFVDAAKKIGYKPEPQPGGGSHKDLIPPHKRGKWTIPPIRDQFIEGRYPQQLSDFLLESLEGIIKPEAIPVKGKAVLDKKR